MKKKIICICIISMFLLTSIASFSAVGITVENQTKKNNTGMTSGKIVNIGSMTIGENFIDFDVENKEVWVFEEGEDVTIEATVHFRLHGWFDHGYAYLGLWDQPPEDRADDDDVDDVTLSFTLYTCKPGDVYEIELKGKYTDLINPDFTERKKIVLTVKEEIEPDLKITEMWTSSIPADWDKEHVIKRASVGPDFFVHLKYSLLYTKEKTCPSFKIRYTVRSWFPEPYGWVIIITIPSTVGTGEPEKMQTWVIQETPVKGEYDMTFELDDGNKIKEKDEGNNKAEKSMWVGYPRSKGISPFLNLLQNNPILFQLLQRLLNL